MPQSLSWFGIVRLGLVQTALGAIVVLAISVMNRVMVVELALPAIVPGILVALHYAVQMLRPRMGYGSDCGQARTPWIVGGMAILAIGGITAAFAILLMRSHEWIGLALATMAFVLIGVGVGASGTSLLVLLAKRCAPERRALAATVVWLMMIAGFVVTTIVAGSWLDPFTPTRLVEVTGTVAALAFFVTVAAVWGVEQTTRVDPVDPIGAVTTAMPSFREALSEVWRDAAARRLTIFVFVSMLAYSAEELILDPFSGTVFGYTPGQSTQLSGALHAGVFGGMLLVAVVCSLRIRSRWVALHTWMTLGCVGSALALLGLAGAGLNPSAWPLRENVMLLGLANGTFAVAAIGSMMQLAGAGPGAREGVRMGLWGAAQGVAFAAGGLWGAAASDVARSLVFSAGTAYAFVFAGEALLFLLAALVALYASGHRFGLLPAPKVGAYASIQPNSGGLL